MEKSEMIDLDINGLKYRVNEDKWNTILDNNKKVIKDFDKHNKAKGLREPTRLGQIEELVKFANYINRPFIEVKDDRKLLENFFEEGFEIVKNGNELKQNTKMRYINLIRKFYKWLTREEEPIITQDFKGFQPSKTVVTEQMTITREEMKKITDSFSDPQRKAGILFLFDTGMRPTEFLRLKRKDITNRNGQWYVDVVNGKTGTRTIPLILSPQYLERWLNEYHPYKDKKDAPLWISRSHRSNNKPYTERALSYSGLFEWTKQSEKIIGRRIWSKLFRHSRFSDYAENGMPESMMRYVAGWTGGSRMTDVYLHPHKNMIVDKMRAIEGLQPKEEIKKPTISPITCPKCGKENPYDVKTCISCWHPLDPKVALEEMQEVKILKEQVKTSIKQIEVEQEKEKKHEQEVESLRVQLNNMTKKMEDYEQKIIAILEGLKGKTQSQ